MNLPTTPVAPADRPTIVAVADHAILVEFATEIDDAANAAAIALDRAIRARPIHGVTESVPAYVSVLVDFDPLTTDHAEVEAAVRALLADTAPTAVDARHHVATVCFDADLAPDLDAVAALTDRSVDDVIDAFVGSEFTVAMYGFAPGYAYLSGVASEIRLPRKPAPVRGVPAGSVIIAGAQCLITTIDMPTGWWVIGRSPTRVLRPHHAEPFLFAPGDRVRFERVERGAFDEASDTEDDDPPSPPEREPMT